MIYIILFDLDRSQSRLDIEIYQSSFISWKHLIIYGKPCIAGNGPQPRHQEGDQGQHCRHQHLVSRALQGILTEKYSIQNNQCIQLKCGMKGAITFSQPPPLPKQVA